MKRRWLRGVQWLLGIEVCLYIAGACRPYGDYRGDIDRSRPLLLLQNGALAISVDGRQRRRFEINDEPTRKLAYFVRKNNPPRARSAGWGWICDERNELLGKIDEDATFAYNPEADVLAWRGQDSEILYIREGGRTRKVYTWTIHCLPRINSDGTIWLGEDNPMHVGGIAVLDRTGRFLGWRAKNPVLSMADKVAEADETVMPLVEKLLARPRDKYYR